MSANDREHLKIFGCSAGLHLAREMCNHLELPIGGGKATRFPDGEIIVKLEEDADEHQQLDAPKTRSVQTSRAHTELLVDDGRKPAAASKVVGAVSMVRFHRSARTSSAPRG